GHDHRVRICCECDTPYRVQEDSPLAPRCPRCRYDFDEVALEFRHWHGCKRPLTPQMLKHIAVMGEKIEYCAECGERTAPHTMELRRIIDKHFSTLCAEARRERFKKNEDFMKSMAEIGLTTRERTRMDELRKAVLVLTENCTAWLYLTKPLECNHLKSEVSRLFRQLLAIQRVIPTMVSRDAFIKQMDSLEQAIGDLIVLFRQYLE
ncbi:hypothetical protein OESDEN_20625, partial [Oesophagostomum dentatum]